ncbi:MAG: hypothetical protein K1060chlam3_00697 [Candidatus Anoxychlamydiales bacterium]|nr:hypothetical protein [Candidatus Anoxychlamydiales bacterium]
MLSVDFFEDILDENNDQLSDLDEKTQKLETVLRRVVFNRAEIDKKIIAQQKHIKGLNLKFNNCKGKSKKGIRRESYLVQIKLEKDLLDGLKKQSEELKELKSQMESRMSSFKDEKSSIEKI